jgi:hypothetical protein
MVSAGSGWLGWAALGLGGITVLPVAWHLLRGRRQPKNSADDEPERP